MKSWNKKSKNIIEIQKDRFIRFGYVCFKKICKKFNTTIVEETMKNLCRILCQYFICSPADCMGFLIIERDEKIAEELQDGNKSDRRAESQNS
mgnify:CR=1 FL=1